MPTIGWLMVVRREPTTLRVIADVLQALLWRFHAIEHAVEGREVDVDTRRREDALRLCRCRAIRPFAVGAAHDRMRTALVAHRAPLPVHDLPRHQQ